MKNKLSLLNLSLVAVCLILNLACGFLNRSDNNSSNLSASNGNSNTNVSTNTNSAANLPTPYPPADCPSTLFSVHNIEDGKHKIYEGCTVTFRGKLFSVEDKFAKVLDESERTDIMGNGAYLEGRTISCSGDFSDNTSHQIGQKLASLKRDKIFVNPPTGTFKATVQNSSLTDCYMVGFQK